NVKGRFVCGTERCGNREWESSVIATNLRFSKVGNSYKATLHAQQCNRCEKYAEPIVEVETYVERVVYMLDLWMGVREREKPSETNRRARRPHDRSRCHGCKVGEC
ncbi:zinc-binding domain-containing protein, partial [Lobosporangium transversale]